MANSANEDLRGCSTCGTLPARACARCKLDFYCSQNCQRKDWKRHSALCRSQGTDAAPLLHLPDDVLLHVLSFLSPEELFGLRVVCRRFQDLCLHPDLWRSVKLYFMELAVRSVLHRAPCLGEIRVEEDGDFLVKVAPWLLRTKCVVAKLCQTVRGPFSVLSATNIVPKLSALGGLKSIDLDIQKHFSMVMESCPSPDLTQLLRSVFSVKDLRKLKVSIQSNVPMPRSCCGDLKMMPSLTDLVYTSDAMDSFLEQLLRTHAATLECVSVKLRNGDVPVSLLKRVGKLRSLTCYASEALSQWEASSTLEHLDLSTLDGNDFPRGALNFLRRTTLLRHASLSLPSKEPSAPLWALGESLSATVIQSLRLSSCTPQLLKQVVAAELHQFPSLQLLVLDATPSDEFLQALGPANAPQLATLRVPWSSSSLFRQRPCPHAWIHGHAVQGLLARNSRLHLRLYDLRPPTSWGRKDKDCDCQLCCSGCHVKLNVRCMKAWPSIAAHGRTADCPRDCFQVKA